MYTSYCSFVLFTIISFTYAWEEWIGTFIDKSSPSDPLDQNAVASSTISTRLYAGAVSFISWSQNDADLCTSGECTLNAAGYDIGLSKEYVLIFGGRKVSADNTSELLFDTCEVDFLQVELDGTCTGTPKNDLILVDLDNNVTTTLVPTYNTDLYTSMQIPPARYGHKTVYMERTEFDSTANMYITRKYMFMYGGYSDECGGYCDDLWRYEIPWAAQGYYPQDGSTYWKRGNYWDQMVTTTNPGNKTWFSMVSDFQEYIYLFGGAKQLSDGTRIVTNDLWQYSVTDNTWTQLSVQKVTGVMRNVTLWDNSSHNIEIDINSRRDGDVVNLTAIALSACVDDDSIPSCRAFSSMSLDNDTNRLILAGGLNPASDTSNYLKSIWSFEIGNRIWTLLMNDSDTIEVPGSTAFASNTYLKGSFYRYQFYFGGVVAEGERRDNLWAFDFILNKSVELVQQPLSDTQTYPLMNKGMALVRLIQKRGVFLFGGYLFQTLTTDLATAKTTYLTECQANLTAYGFKLSDAFTSAWAAKYATTGDTCLETIPEWLTAEYEFTLNNQMWIYLESFCRITNSSLGSCFWGRSKCNSGLYGADCSNPQCLNSMCYQEQTSLADAVCIHCFGKGSCVDGTCQCDSGYTYADCSGTDCPNNCSNTATEEVATCNLMYPLSVCECYTSTKRGGDDCSYIFCLNDCGGHGSCTDGVCTCDTNYYGTDCSIFDIDFIDSSSASRLSYISITMFLYIIIFV